ncbi:hypothetical protein AAG570_006940 [Ranatra chinensis]|uniref:Uncharacterized protein n=1 Tax=Ranatra chinensis TaxID=642074 RepID=A0ABD0ZCF2_9HEMI
MSVLQHGLFVWCRDVSALAIAYRLKSLADRWMLSVRRDGKQSGGFFRGAAEASQSCRSITYESICVRPPDTPILVVTGGGLKYEWRATPVLCRLVAGSSSFSVWSAAVVPELSMGLCLIMRLQQAAIQHISEECTACMTACMPATTHALFSTPTYGRQEGRSGSRVDKGRNCAESRGGGSGPKRGGQASRLYAMFGSINRPLYSPPLCPAVFRFFCPIDSFEFGSYNFRVADRLLRKTGWVFGPENRMWLKFNLKPFVKYEVTCPVVSELRRMPSLWGRFVLKNNGSGLENLMTFSKSDPTPHSSAFNMGYLVSPYHYPNGTPPSIPVSMNMAEKCDIKKKKPNFRNEVILEEGCRVSWSPIWSNRTSFAESTSSC